MILNFDIFINTKLDNFNEIYESSIEVLQGDNSLNEKRRCWKGYCAVPGKNPYEPGSCKKCKKKNTK